MVHQAGGQSRKAASGHRPSCSLRIPSRWCCRQLACFCTSLWVLSWYQNEPRPKEAMPGMDRARETNREVICSGQIFGQNRSRAARVGNVLVWKGMPCVLLNMGSKFRGRFEDGTVHRTHQAPACCGAWPQCFGSVPPANRKPRIRLGHAQLLAAAQGHSPVCCVLPAVPESPCVPFPCQPGRVAPARIGACGGACVHAQAAQSSSGRLYEPAARRVCLDVAGAWLQLGACTTPGCVWLEQTSHGA